MSDREREVEPWRRARRSPVDLFRVGEELLLDAGRRTLSPLCRVETTEDAVTVTFDLPYVEKKDITLTSTGDSVSVRAETRKPVSFKVGGGVQRSVVFERFTRYVELPTTVLPEKAEATFKNGILRVKFPVEKRGSRVRIG